MNLLATAAGLAAATFALSLSTAVPAAGAPTADAVNARISAASVLRLVGQDLPTGRTGWPKLEYDITNPGPTEVRLVWWTETDEQTFEVWYADNEGPATNHRVLLSPSPEPTPQGPVLSPSTGKEGIVVVMEGSFPQGNLKPGAVDRQPVEPFRYDMSKPGTYWVTAVLDLTHAYVVPTSTAVSPVQFHLHIRSNTIVLRRNDAGFVDITPPVAAKK